MKTHAQVVIIGGGIMGVGLLYHLPREGWSDVVLVEKGELTSGSTWHAAALVPNFIGTLNMAKVHHYGSELYGRLEEETGQSTGWHQCGSIRLAITDHEVDWFKYVSGILDYVGAENHLITPSEISELHPLLKLDDVQLGLYTPTDGHTDPASSTNAMAISARKQGAEIYRRTLVTNVSQSTGGEWIVTTDQGEIVCEHVVNAAGSFESRDSLRRLFQIRGNLIKIFWKKLHIKPPVNTVNAPSLCIRCFIGTDNQSLLLLTIIAGSNRVAGYRRLLLECFNFWKIFSYHILMHHVHNRKPKARHLRNLI